jgi:hypothetical protein
MGASLSEIDCSCVLPKFNIEALTAGQQEGGEDVEKRQRREALIRGNNWLRPAWGGLSSQEITLKLAEDYSTLRWSTVAKGLISGTSEFGEIALETILNVKMDGKQGIQLIAAEGKAVFTAQAETAEVRDRWVLCLNELLDDWKANPASKPKAQLTAASTSNKDAYFKQRAAEIEQREKENKAKIAKYSVVGMKHTAAAMARA